MSIASAEDNKEGFRLHRFEVRNWGTFHQQVWKICPTGDNALLTGDIGSGKSTLVDGLTTLLVPKPANQIVFNKAAGSEAQERSLASYVRGEYKSEKDEVTAAARAIALRDDRDYSVLLANFENRSLRLSVSIAQLLYFKEKGGKVERLFVVADRELSIRDHFCHFDSIAQLKGRLRQQELVPSGSLRQYAGQMRRALGIQNERALDLFYQTVSMKSVDNLTQFVREHMLDPGDNRQRVATLCQSFEDLDRAHAAVVRTRTQIDALRPLVNDGDQLLLEEKELRSLRRSREMLEVWRANHELKLEQQREYVLTDEQSGFRLGVARLGDDIAELRNREDSIRSSLNDNGGRRLEEIKSELQRLENERQRRRGYAEQYQQAAKTLSLIMPTDAAAFQLNQQQASKLLREAQEEQATLDDQRVELIGNERKLKEGIAELELEITELKQRTGNIPSRNLALRRTICETLGIEEDQLPYAGELMQVSERAGQWEGAAERALHNFGLSLLVPEHLYSLVADYVDKTDLRGRIVYFRVGQPRHSVDVRQLSQQSLVHKLQLKDDCFCYDWLLSRLVERFDYSCCANIADFRRLPRAITLNGQIKSGGDRHEKDDRCNLRDRSGYVLGWDNHDKLRVLDCQRTEQQKLLADVHSQLRNIKQDKAVASDRQQGCSTLAVVKDFEDIDWQTTARKISSMRGEQEQIQNSSDVLRELQEKLAQAQSVREDKEQKQLQLNEQLAECGAALKQCKENQRLANEIIAEIDAAECEKVFPVLEEIYLQHFDSPPSLKNIRLRERELRAALQKDIDNRDKRRDRLHGSVVQQMANYLHNNQAETQEMDANIEALEDFRRMLRELQEDDLPRFEAKFKQELNEKTIQSLVHFSTQLDRALSELKAKIAHINQSLIHIDYNEGCYIQLMTDAINDSEIRQFRQDLRGCLSETLGQDLYDESRFLQVKAIIERFRGREGFSDADKRWTRKVTDVRNWSTFSAEELWREDDSRKDYFESSSGKSGGQKEKLAYTVLASALAYQFGLDQADNVRSYRFVVIDEAFGRGSEASTRYALELFKRLGLQLLVVTPLTKIHVIEPFIRHVHFVHNENNRNSQLRNMSIEEYREEKAKREQEDLPETLQAL